MSSIVSLIKKHFFTFGFIIRFTFCFVFCFLFYSLSLFFSIIFNCPTFIIQTCYFFLVSLFITLSGSTWEKMQFSKISILAFLATGAVATPIPSPDLDPLQSVNEAHLFTRTIKPQKDTCKVRLKSLHFYERIPKERKKNSLVDHAW